MARCNLLVFSMVLLACSNIPARISGRSIDDAAMIKSEDDGTETRTTTTAAAAGVVLRSYNGCSYNKNPHDANSIFCCDKDKECWATLQECMPNCPCKANCSAKKRGSADPRLTSLLN